MTRSGPTTTRGLGVEDLLAAYRDGWFPMADEGRLRWHCPDPRTLMDLGGFHVPRSLRKTLRAGRFTLTSDAAFPRVIDECARPRPGREATWIDARIRSAYVALHERGHAHSVEAWAAGEGDGGGGGGGGGGGALVADGRALVGGVYGVSIGSAFFAESMFSAPEWGGTDASKVALAHLVAHLRRRGYTLMDVQFPNPHIARFGLVLVRRADYRSALARACADSDRWGRFEPTAREAW